MIPNLTIAAELGQRSGAGLVASTYGDPQNIVGDHRLDWLPAEGKGIPAWELLRRDAGAEIISFSGNV